MPELPFVEKVRRRLLAEAVGRTFKKVEVLDDAVVFANADSKKWATSLKGNKILNVHRRGKFFWLEMDKKPFPTFHFGMTGDFKFDQDLQDAPKEVDKMDVEEKEAEKKDPEMEEDESEPFYEWPPRFWKAVFTLDNGRAIAFTDVRRFARGFLIDEDPLTVPPISKLGFDPIINMPTKDAFYEALQKRAKPIKALLLDQSFSAGVGNWIADEILYQAKIHPARLANALSREESDAVHFQTHDVCRIAVEANNKHSDFPKNWLFHYRWSKGKKEGKPKTFDGDAIEFDVVGGRTTAIVPAIQKKSGSSKVKIARAKSEPAEAPTKQKGKRKEKEEKVQDSDDDFAKTPRGRRSKKEPEVKATPRRQPKRKIEQVEEAKGQVTIAAARPLKKSRKMSH